jgi:signal transduction histidine kinase
VSGKGARLGWRTPLALQVLALVFACLAFAQLLALAIIIIAPPPRRAPVFLSELAQALSGGRLETVSGRKLVRSVVAATSPTAPRQHPVSGRSLASRQALAGLLHAPLEGVVLNETQASPLSRVLTHGVDVGGPPPPPPAAAERLLHAEYPPNDPPRLGMLIFEDFTAALPQPGGRVVVVRPAAEAFPTPWQLSIMAWLLGAAVVVAPIVVWFGRRITAPLNDFASAAQRLGRDPLAPPLPMSGPAEIRRAAQAFNDMQLRVRRYVDDRTGMVGAISHDLRTPLARIRFKLEAEPPDKAAITSDLTQMETMIAQVLAFLRDASEPQARERINLLSLVETVVDDAAMLGGQVRLLQADDSLVEGDVQGLQRVVGNLIDNAVKYGGRADIRVMQDRGEAVVEIEDDGPGLNAREQTQVFKPFFRTEAARTLDRGGVGLGLALSRSIARAHGGDIALDVRSRGLVASLRLPICAPARDRR